MVSLKSKVHQKKLNGVVVHPYFYTMVMRGLKNRKETHEEKGKRGVTYSYITGAGLTMQFSICGKTNHHKKVHAKYMKGVQNKVDVEVEDEDADGTSVLQVCFITRYSSVMPFMLSKIS